jgi:2-methylcitrate dehydratase PrpD
MNTHGLQMADIASVVTHVHQGAIDVLGAVTQPTSVHQSKFSMGTVLALVARFQFAGLDEFDTHFQDADIVAFRDRVTMVLDEEVDRAYPRQWLGKVSVTTTDGRTLAGRIDEPKGDPGNTLSRAELSTKAHRLARYSDAASPAEMQAALDYLWQIESVEKVGDVLRKVAA